MKVLSRVSETWSQERFPDSSDLDSSSTEFIGSKIELLVKHIEAFLEELGEVSVMGQDLVQLLEVQLSIIKKKNLEVI